MSAANTHDSLCLESLIQAIPAIRSRRGPRRRRPDKLHADKGYDYPHLRRMLRARGIRPRIACRGIESPNRLGRHRWVIERTFAWLTGYRRLTIRYDRSASLYCAFVTLVAALTCHGSGEFCSAAPESASSWPGQRSSSRTPTTWAAT